MDRYCDIHAAEDLGGIEMFPDLTPDLRKESAPAPVAAGDEGGVQTPITTKGIER